MPTANEAIQQLQIRHAVGLQRYSAHVVREVIRILETSDREIVAKLRARGATLEGTFTSERFKTLLEAVREINQAAHTELANRLRPELRELAKYEAQFQAQLIQRAVPVAVDIVTPPAGLLNAVVTSKPFEGRLLREWVAELSAGKMKRLRDALRLGMVQGETVEQIVRRIAGTRANNYRDGILEISRRGARAMVQTATNHVANSAREEMFKANEDLIKKVQWVATLDTRTCPTCSALDGEVFDIDQGPRPPRHINCRCTTIPITKSWRELGIDLDEVPPGTRASMNGQVPSTMNYQSWLKSQSAEVQDEALGKTRGALFRRGGLTVDRFVDTRGNQLTLDELRETESRAFKRANL
jgi:SPP1 gp7 family putative phage head morphogenesis protein